MNNNNSELEMLRALKLILRWVCPEGEEMKSRAEIEDQINKFDFTIKKKEKK